jgi:hypothetical protein
MHVSGARDADRAMPPNDGEHPQQAHHRIEPVLAVSGATEPVTELLNERSR